MTLHRSLLVASIGFGLLQAGCLGDSNEVDELGDVELETLDLNDPSSGGGNNGLPDGYYHAEQASLWTGTFGSFTGSNTILSAMAGTTSGHKVLEYAARCALPEGDHYLGTYAFSGEGILTTTSGWLTSPLGTSTDRQPKYDLFECMIAHVNAFGITVPIRLSGASVASTMNALDRYRFRFKEAIWVAYEETNAAGSILKLEAWPLADLQEGCGPNTSMALEKRVCGNVPGACSVHVRNDLQACSQDPNTGFWTCEGHPAIQTWLESDTWLTTLYRTTCNGT